MAEISHTVRGVLALSGTAHESAFLVLMTRADLILTHVPVSPFHCRAAGLWVIPGGIPYQPGGGAIHAATVL